MKIKLVDGREMEVTTRKEIEALWKDNKVSLREASSTLTVLLALPPANAVRVWKYLEGL